MSAPSGKVKRRFLDNYIETAEGFDEVYVYHLHLNESGIVYKELQTLKKCNRNKFF